jgi:hypothetical protein
MAKYKIEVDTAKTGYIATLLERKWFTWYVKDFYIDALPYSEQIEQWQSDFNIPDKNVKLLFIKKIKQ